MAMPNLRRGWLRYFFHWLTTQIFWHGGNLGFGRLHRTDSEVFDLDLYWPFSPDNSRIMTPLVFACSPNVIPRPDDWAAPHIRIPGYLFLDTPETYQPPPALAKFLAEGEPPVCVTFGSMIHRDAERIYRIVLEAIKRTGNRAVILSGWSDLRNFSLPEDVLNLDAMPHDWLFPRCKTIIHHGGAGATAAGLRSGIPNLVVSFAADQPFWGARVQALGAGPRPIPVRKLTTEKLIAALAEADGETVRNSAQVTGSIIRAEDGIGQTVKIIEEHVVKWRAAQQSENFKV